MKKIIIFILAISGIANAEFSQTTFRYISGYDFENKMRNLFPSAFLQNGYETASDVCFENSESATVKQFGFNSPATGAPMMQVPNSATVQAIGNCIISVVNKISTNTQGQNLKNILPDSILQKMGASPALYTWELYIMKDFSEDEVKQIIFNSVEQILGTDDVILSYHLILDIDLYRAHLFSKIDKSKNLKQTMEKIFMTLILRDEFLMY